MTSDRYGEAFLSSGTWDIWGTHNYMLGISVKIFLKLDVKFRSDKASTENYFTMQVAVPDPSVLDHSSMGASGLELRQTF